MRRFPQKLSLPQQSSLGLSEGPGLGILVCEEQVRPTWERGICRRKGPGSPRPPQAKGWVTSVLAPEYFTFTFHCSRKSVWPGMGLGDSARKQERERAGPGEGSLLSLGILTIQGGLWSSAHLTGAITGLPLSWGPFAPDEDMKSSGGKE